MQHAYLFSPQGSHARRSRRIRRNGFLIGVAVSLLAALPALMVVVCDVRPAGIVRNLSADDAERVAQVRAMSNPTSFLRMRGADLSHDAP